MERREASRRHTTERWQGYGYLPPPPPALQSLKDLGRLTYRRFLELFRHMVGLLGRVISPSQGLYLHRTTQHRKSRTNIHAYDAVFPDHSKIRANHGRKASVYEESCGSKKVSFKRTKHTLSCQITWYIRWTASDVTCRNEQHHENVEGSGNTDSSASGDSNHISFNQYVCRKNNIIANAYFLTTCCVLFATRVSGIARFTTSINTVYFICCKFNLHFLAILLTCSMSECLQCTWLLFINVDVLPTARNVSCA
jgi:hypothetical protein